MPRYLLLSFLIALATTFVEAKTEYYATKALPGDGVFSLLRRYGLDRNSCNVSQFYKLNKFGKDKTLKVGQSYFLPIMIYGFNGKTIRSSVGIEDWGTAKNIEAYNDQMLKDGYRAASFKTDKKLWVPYHLIHCPSIDVPSPDLDETESNGEVNLAVEPAGNRNFPIFGKKYQHVPLKDNSLRGKVFFVESGHGGPDPGAIAKVGKHTLCEDEYAYDVALRLVRNLVAHGATAYMITRDGDDGIRDDQFLKCDDDEVVWGNEEIYRGQKKRLFQRSDVINELYEKHKKQGVTDQKLIVIHVDSRGKREQTDIFFYYHPDDKAGKRIATDLHKSMAVNYKKHRSGRGYDGTVTSRDLHMLRETNVPSAYVELANIKHPTDQQRLILARNRQLLADWLMEGLK